MGCSASRILYCLRLGVVGMLLVLSLVACGQVSTSSGPALKSSPTGVSPSVGGPSTADSLAISGTPPAGVVAGQSYSFTPTAASPSGGTLSFTIVNLPPWASFDPSTGLLSGTPAPSGIGVYANIQIGVSDGQATVTLPAFSISVVAQLSLSGSPATQAVAGSNYSFVPTTNAANGTALTFSIQNRPAWASFNPSTGELSGIAQAGSFPDVVITVTDGLQSSAITAFSITVSANSSGGAPPTISGHPATGVLAGSSYSFTPTASDAAGHALTFSIQNQPSWASFSASSGTLTGTPATGNAGNYANIVISVSNGTHSASLAPFSIKVSAPLKISGSPSTQVTAGKGYSFQPTTSAPNGSALMFSIQNRPVWASFIAGTGTLSGTPVASQTGTYSGIVISVSDGVQTVALPPFAITVQSALTIAGSPPTSVTVASPYSFTPSASGASGTALRFSIQNQPSWATFNAANGALTGAPNAANVGTYANIVISVSDGTQSVALSPFTIQVVKGVTISGTPLASVNAGSPYGFTPTASGPSGSTLTFSIQNQPPWATFNAANGALTGTPGAANVGTYSNIVIAVTSGGASASLPAFTISVNQVSNGTAALTWTPVTKNTDGTVLANLAGYRVHYGTSANAMNTVVTLSNPSLTNYLVTNLSSGTWYFGITAYTASGMQSSLSNVGQKTIP